VLGGDEGGVCTGGGVFCWRDVEDDDVVGVTTLWY
jgi:hypothetical protein